MRCHCRNMLSTLSLYLQRTGFAFKSRQKKLWLCTKDVGNSPSEVLDIYYARHHLVTVCDVIYTTQGTISSRFATLGAKPHRHHVHFTFLSAISLRSASSSTRRIDTCLTYEGRGIHGPIHCLFFSATTPLANGLLTVQTPPSLIVLPLPDDGRKGCKRQCPCTQIARILLTSKVCQL